MPFDIIGNAQEENQKRRNSILWLKYLFHPGAKPEIFKSTPSMVPRIESLSDQEWHTALFQELQSRLIHSMSRNESLTQMGVEKQVETLLGENFSTTFNGPNRSIEKYTKALIDLVINPPGHLFQYFTVGGRHAGTVDLRREELFRAMEELLEHFDATHQARIERQELRASCGLGPEPTDADEAAGNDVDEDEEFDEDYQEDSDESMDDYEDSDMDVTEDDGVSKDAADDEVIEDAEDASYEESPSKEGENPLQALAELFQKQKRQGKRAPASKSSVLLVNENSFLDLALSTFNRYVNFMIEFTESTPEVQKVWKETKLRFEHIEIWLREAEDSSHTMGTADIRAAQFDPTRLPSTSFFTQRIKRTWKGIEDSQRPFADSLVCPHMEHFFWESDVDFETLSQSKIPWGKLRLNKHSLHVHNPAFVAYDMPDGIKIPVPMISMFRRSVGLIKSGRDGTSRSVGLNRSNFRLHALSNYYIGAKIWREPPAVLESGQGLPELEAVTCENFQKGWEGPGLTFFAKLLKVKTINKIMMEIEPLMSKRKVPYEERANLMKFIKDELLAQQVRRKSPETEAGASTTN